MIKIFIVAFILSITSFYSFAKNSVDSAKTILSGNVYSDENNPLGNILINISGYDMSYKIYSDNSGRYETEILPGKYNITVRTPGYNIYEYKITDMCR